MRIIMPLIISCTLYSPFQELKALAKKTNVSAKAQSSDSASESSDSDEEVMGPFISYYFHDYIHVISL